MEFDPDEDQSNPWLLIVIGIALLGAAGWAYSTDFSEFSLRAGPMTGKLLYFVFGKWGVVAISGLVGVCFLGLGLGKLRET